MAVFGFRDKDKDKDEASEGGLVLNDAYQVAVESCPRVSGDWVQ